MCVYVCWCLFLSQPGWLNRIWFCSHDDPSKDRSIRSLIRTGGRKWYWKHLKQMLQMEENLCDSEKPNVSYAQLEAPPSVYPPAKYCDITGLEVIREQQRFYQFLFSISPPPSPPPPPPLHFFTLGSRILSFSSVLSIQVVSAWLMKAGAIHRPKDKAPICQRRHVSVCARSSR